jgi:hypothetical protein
MFKQLAEWLTSFIFLVRETNENKGEIEQLRNNYFLSHLSGGNRALICASSRPRCWN